MCWIRCARLCVCVALFAPSSIIPLGDKLIMVAWSPIPRQQFVDPVDGMPVANPFEGIGQPSLRVHVVELGRLQQGVDGGSALPATVGTSKELVLPAHGYAAQGVFREVVVDLKPPVLGIGEQLGLELHGIA